MQDTKWNKNLWDERYNWSQHGDEWSKPWGSARAQWYGAIFPRIANWLPAHRVLEIATGHGRWTQYLLQHTFEYSGVDIASVCAQFCEKRFAAHPNCRFYVNDGYDLSFVADNSIDFVFSFDSLVHAELDVMEAYCKQILKKLTPRGVAFLHHSNFKKFESEVQRGSLRATSVSSTLVKEIIDNNSGAVFIQEEVDWLGTPYLIDCFTTFGRKNAANNYPYKLILNNQFTEEATLIRKYQSQYY